MKLAIISDIHSNEEALTTALEAIDARSVDAIYCLGDIVGYGPSPETCVSLVRERCVGVVKGNHDVAVAEDIGVDYLPRDGQDATRHNRAHLSPDNLKYLADLPLKIETPCCTYVHASPEMPASWMRIDSFLTASNQFNHFTTDICFVGHTHLPAVMANKLGVFHVRAGYRFLINVGSVGQPRDSNPRLSVAFFDTETFQYELVRLPYNLDRTITKIFAANLPKGLGQRLRMGR